MISAVKCYNKHIKPTEKGHIMNNFDGFRKGVNLGGWLSQCDYSDRRLQHFIVKSDIEKIASWGADHVRLPIDYNVLEDENGNPIDRGCDCIDRALGWCAEYGLNLLVDLHKTVGYSFDDGEAEDGFFVSEVLQERFYRLWERLAEKYGNNSHIAFELLNEVTDKSYCADWNRIAAMCIERIRKIAPDTVILVGGYWNNSVDAVKDLDPPHDDRVIYNFHCYDPLEFTHQSAYWVKDKDVSRKISYSESGAGEEYFIAHFAEAAAKAKANNTVLYCGEYGVIDRVAPEEALKWYIAINRAFEKLNISRCVWNYKEMDFGLSDKRMDSVIGELIKYL